MEKQLMDKLASLSTNKEDDEKTMDEFLEKIKNEYKSNWTEDNWEEELEKHPLFMTKEPEPDANGNFSPDIEAIRQLQWDPDLNDPKEIAIKYKDEGNLYFKCSKYRSAVDSYSEALKQSFDDQGDELKSILYSNRAAAHYHLRNYRSALTDCVQARKLNRSNIKPVVKGAECCLYLRMYDDCVKWCEYGLSLISGNSDKKAEENKAKLVDLRTRAQVDKKAFERDMRKKEAADRKRAETYSKLLGVIKSKGVRLQEKDKEFAEMIENPAKPHQKVVSLVNESSSSLSSSPELVWPVIFLYPEFGQTDLIESFHENNSFEDNLKLMFPNKDSDVQSPEWDAKKEYTLKSIQIYYENRDKHKLVKIRKTLTLTEALRLEGMIVQLGTPNFIIMVRDSPFEKLYLEKYNEM